MIDRVSRRLSSLRDELSSRADDLVALRRDLHRFPELAFSETRTAARIAERLAAAGLEISTGIATTGVVGVLRGDLPGRTIAWRADMDALPIDEAVDSAFRSSVEHVMHACGHAGHVAIAVVVAEALASRRSELAGTVVFLFQPAEEILGGAAVMLEAGVLEQYAVEEIYGLHLTSRLDVGRVEACPGVSMAAADVLEIEIHGRGGHGATPDLVVNPIAIAGQLLVGLQGVIASVVPAHDRALMSIGQIIGGSAFNIVPDVISMKGSLRTLRDSDRRELLDRLTAYVQTLVTEQRARAIVRPLGCCPALVNHVDQTALVHRCASDELGASHVDAGQAVMASDDMALFLEKRPGCYFRVGAAPAGGSRPPHHSREFAIDEAGLVVAARVATSVLLTALGA